MAIVVRDDEEDEVMSTINTTPLVDVMLVLLIIFLITIPVVTHVVPVKLPNETIKPYQTKPDNINLSVTADGSIYWGEQKIPDTAVLLDRLQKESLKTPQPEVHVRGDQDVPYEFVGKVLTTSQRAGIAKVGFITQPAPRN